MKENTFQFVFHTLGGNFSGFRQNFSSTVVRTALVSRFLNRTRANCFWTLRGILVAGLSEVYSTCPRIVFMGYIFFEKTTFQVVFHILGGIFSGFRRNFSSAVIRTALVSRFLNWVYASFFSDLTQISIHWSVRTALYVSTELFSWEASSSLKTFFKLFFTIWAVIFQVFAKFFTAR